MAKNPETRFIKLDECPVCYAAMSPKAKRRQHFPPIPEVGWFGGDTHKSCAGRQAAHLQKLIEEYYGEDRIKEAREQIDREMAGNSGKFREGGE